MATMTLPFDDQDDELARVLAKALRSMPPSDRAALLELSGVPEQAPPPSAIPFQRYVREVAGFGPMPPNQSYDQIAGAVRGAVNGGGRTVSITMSGIPATELGTASGEMAKIVNAMLATREALTASPRMAVRLRQALCQIVDLMTPDDAFPTTRFNRETANRRRKTMTGDER